MSDSAAPGVGYEGFEDLSDEEFLETWKNFSLSSPIRIPVAKLSRDFVYKWINRADMRMYQSRRGKGWRPVTATELPSLCAEGVDVEDLHLGTHVSGDDYIVLGEDLVFAKMSRRRAEAIRTYLTKLNADRIQASKEKFHRAGKMLGVQTFEREGL